MIARKYKKDSRVWLHKTSKIRKLFTISSNILCEVKIDMNSEYGDEYEVRDWKAGDCPVFMMNGNDCKLLTQPYDVSPADIVTNFSPSSLNANELNSLR